MRKILLLGKNGQVGWELQRSLAALGHVIALDRHSAPLCGDLSNIDALVKTIYDVKPNIIVNAAAYTAVDQAESDQATAEIINHHAVAAIAQAASDIGALLIHYSTDYVFNGEGLTSWSEDAITSPQNMYGLTKRKGEIAIEACDGDYLIFRTCWVYGAHGKNFLKTMLSFGKTKTELRIIDDQVGAPTGAELIADATALAIVGYTSAKKGIYHLAAKGYTSWHDYALYVFAEARQLGVELKVDTECVVAVASDEFVTAAKRPKNSRLACRKIEDTFGMTLPEWQIGVKRTLTELVEMSS